MSGYDPNWQPPKTRAGQITATIGAIVVIGIVIFYLVRL